MNAPARQPRGPRPWKTLDVSTLFRVPKVGPMVYTIEPFVGLSLGTGVTSAPALFKFPRAVFVTGLLLVPNDPSTLGQWSISIQDETSAWLITDGQGGTHEAAAGALFGLSHCRKFPLQRPVMNQDQWSITVTNNSTGTLSLAGLFLYFDEGIPR